MMKIPNAKLGRCAEIFRREQCAFGNFKAVAGIKILNSGMASARKLSREHADFSVPIGLGSPSSSISAENRTIQRDSSLGSQNFQKCQNSTCSGGFVAALRCLVNEGADDADVRAARALFSGDVCASAGEMSEGTS